MKKVLITGISGFAGSHLAEKLCSGAEVWGIHNTDDVGNLSGFTDRLNLLRFDLLDGERVAEAVSEIRPDVVYHLAAQSVPAWSVKDPATTLNINIFATLNVLEAVRKAAPESVVVNVGSSEEYGEVADDLMPIAEATELLPTNPYAVSKVTQDLLGYQYWKRYGLKVVRCRPFNHFGPRQSDVFVASSFARQVAEIEAGVTAGNVMRVGNLESARDFLDVSDVVSAYEVLAAEGEPGTVYNICSGEATSIRRLLDTLVALSEAEIEVTIDPERYRAGDTRAVYGDPARLLSLGWKPTRSVDEGLAALLDYWRERVAAGGAGK